MTPLVMGTKVCCSKTVNMRTAPRRLRDPATQLWISYQSKLLSSIGMAVTQVEWAVAGQAKQLSRYVSEHLPRETELRAFVLSEARVQLAVARARRDCLTAAVLRVCGPDALANRQFARWLVRRAPHRFRKPGGKDHQRNPEPLVPVMVSIGRPVPADEATASEIRVFLAPTQDPGKAAMEWPALERMICNKLELACLRSLLKHTRGGRT